MLITLDKNQEALIDQIKVAGSQEEVKKLIDKSLINLSEINNSPATKGEFVRTILAHLETLNPINKNASQWSNINMARIHFNYINRNLPAGK